MKIRTILFKGVPHYTDGELTLPVIAGAQIDWERIEAAKGRKPYRQPQTAINTAEQLKKHIRDFDKMSLMDIINNLQKRGLHLTSGYYKELQDNLLQTEAKTGAPLTMLAGTTPFTQEVLDFVDRGGASADTRDYAGEDAANDARQAAREEAERAWREEQAYLEWQRQQQAEAEQRAWQAEQERQQREWEAQQAEIERQNRLRLQRLGDLTNLVGQFAGIQARARETLAGLQGDPFKFAAAKQGLAMPGATPMESFGNELTQFAGQAMPQIDPNAPLSAIEQQIMGLQGQMAPQAPRIFGMAGGGQVRGQEQTVLVGEGGRPEIVVGTDFKVIPLTASAAAGYDTSSLLPALAPLYGGKPVPTARREGYGTGIYGGGQPGQSGFKSGADLIGQLGYSPRFIRDQTSGQIYFDHGDTIQPFSMNTNPIHMGINPTDILNVNIGEGYGKIQGQPLNAIPGHAAQLSAFGPLSSPIVEPVTGAILPAPFRAAAFLNQLRLQNPQMYQLALSAYANSISRAGDPNARLGYTQEGVEAEVRQALPFGQEHGLIGLR